MTMTVTSIQAKEQRMRFLNEDAVAVALRERIAASAQISLAVAFWGAGATRDLGLDQRPDAKIVLNLAMGGTNPAEVAYMRQIGLKVRQADDLHGKVYLFDDAAIIGSSNASSNGLAFQNGDGLGWREANLLVDDPGAIDDARIWLRALKSRPITDDDLDRAQIAWRRRRDAVDAVAGATSLLDQLERRSGFFSDRAVYLTVWMNPMDPEAEEALGEAQVRHKQKNLGAWQDFPGLPREGHFLDFELDDQGCVTATGLWRRSLALDDQNLGPSGMLQFCTKTRSVFGLSYDPRREKGRWTEIVQQVRGSVFWNDKVRCAVVPFSELRALSPGGALERRFHQALQGLYQRTLLETDYKPNRFHDLLAQGGVAAAKALLARNEVTTGFSALVERGRSDLTIEAEVLQPAWEKLFTDQERRIARLRLARI